MFLPNDRYPLDREVFRLYYTSRSDDQQTIDVYVEDNTGQVCLLYTSIKVYNKFSSGDPDTSKTAASWFGACIFLIVAATILRSFFL